MGKTYPVRASCLFVRIRRQKLSAFCVNGGQNLAKYGHFVSASIFSIHPAEALCFRAVSPSHGAVFSGFGNAGMP